MIFLGIDYGEKFVGVAISEGKYAEGIMRIAQGEVVFRLRRLCDEYHVDKIVIGLSEGRFKDKIYQFGRLLKEMLVIPVVFWDETLSTQQAQEKLKQYPISTKRRRNKEHQVAAAIMLESYLQKHKPHESG